MYAEAKKAIYGTLEASLIFWSNFQNLLCDMKKIIDNKQCTILWHIDDLKTSHVDPAVD